MAVSFKLGSRSGDRHDALVAVLTKLAASPNPHLALDDAAHLDPRLASALEEVAARIRAGAEREHELEARLVQAEEERARFASFQAAVDNVSTNVMIADADGKITYMNKAIVAMFTDAEEDIRKDLPRFRVAEMVGSNIDVYHKVPDYQRGILKKLSGTHNAELNMGGRTFRQAVNTVTAPDGTRLGWVVEWKDVTNQLRLEREMARIKVGLDSVSTNVMISDASGDIVYMNRAIVEMFKNAEADIRKDLPHFRADSMIGNNIHIYHKVPEHQKRILGNLNGTHRAEIVIGGRTFRQGVNPVIGESGAKLGYVVEWQDATDEVRVQKETSEIVQAAAAGDFSQRIDTTGRTGFFLALAEHLNLLLGTAERGLADVGRVLGALSQGDLTQEVHGEYQGTFRRLKDDSNRTVESLAGLIESIRGTADLVSTAAREIALGNSDLSTRTEQQAANLEETASSMEELTATVQQNAENARKANDLAIGASEIASKGGEVVGQVVTMMESINASAKKVVEIISVIDGIAFQTNILALNAAVEAARAGEQGRGFAVVAGEVRNLAQRSAAAAKEIKGLIGDSVEKTGAGTRLVDQAGVTMNDVVVSVKRVTEFMAEIAAASSQQRAGIEQVNRAVAQMEQVTQQNAALVEEASAAAVSLEEQAGNLVDSISVFKLNGESSSASRPAMLDHAAPAKPRQRPAKALEGRRTALPSAPADYGDEDDWKSF